jgi:mannitol/fructose-specific phosphotransferase system IIA component (Ntr-type)
MRKSARGAAAERKADRRAIWRRLRLRRRLSGSVAIPHAREEAVKYQSDISLASMIEPARVGLQAFQDNMVKSADGVP